MKHKNNAFKDWKEIRRNRAIELYENGWKLSKIAEALGVSRSAVSQWIAAVDADEEAWRSKPRGHRPSRLSDEQMNLIPDLLSHGAEAYGFIGQVWTCERIAEVIKEEFSVSYHKAHVSRLLKALKWTPQLPRERALQRDEEAIEKWRIEVWPMLKKKRQKRA